MKTILRIFLLALVVYSASACKPASATPAAVNDMPTASIAAYPSPVSASEAYPAPTGENPAYPAPIGENPAYPAPSAAQGAYPYPAPVVQSTANPEAYPAPADTANTVLATSGPTPEAAATDSSVVIGRLTENGKPVVNATIYLAEIKKDESGEYQVAAYSRSDSPRAYTDADGRFVFINITPGSYCLVFDNFATYMVLNDPKGEADQALKFTAEAGKVLDLGTLDYEDLPAL